MMLFMWHLLREQQVITQIKLIMNQQGKYVVRESTDYGCKVYNVVNTETGNRINYYPDYELAKEFADRQNKNGKE